MRLVNFVTRPDAPWCQMHNLPFRPFEGLYLKDDFAVNEGVADATLGELDWEFVTIANASSTAYLVTTNTVPGRPGIFRDTTAGTADGDGEVYRLDEDNIVLQGGYTGSFSFGVRIPAATGNALAGNDFRIGLQDSVTATEPTVGIWVFCDAGVLSLQADSADHGDAADTFDLTGLTTNTTLALDDWLDCKVSWSGTNAQGGPKYVVAEAQVNGGGFRKVAEITDCHIDDDEEMEFSIVHYQNSGGADTLELDVDYVDLLLQGRG